MRDKYFRQFNACCDPNAPRRWAMVSMAFSVMTAAALLLVATTAHAQLPVIALRSLSQSFFAPGGEYEIGIAEGANTEEVRQLVCSHPGISATLLTDPAKPFAKSGSERFGKFRLVISPDVPEGRYEVRAVGRFGISNPRSIVIGNDIRLVASGGVDPATATPLELDAIHCRRASPRVRDFYSMPVTKGQRYDLQLVSQAVDSRLIGAVSVIDSKGRTIGSAIGSDHSDVRLSFTAGSDATLMIVVHDALFRGGAAYQYGLLATQGATPSPSIGDAIGDAIRYPQSISVRNLDPQAIDEHAAPTKLDVPAVVEATFDSANDVDQYICAFAKSKQVLIEVVSDRIGQPSDPRLVIDRAVDDAAGVRTWQRVVTGDDSQNLSDSVVRLASRDPVLRFTPPEDGEYRISVMDLDTGQSLGAVQRYQLAIGPATADWSLLAYHVYPQNDAKASRPQGWNLIRGGSTTIRVFVIRSGMPAAIKVTIPNLPEGLICNPAWIAPNQNLVDLVITASEPTGTTAEPQSAVQTAVQWNELEIIGEVQNGDDLQTRSANAAAVVWELDGYRPNIKTRLIDRLMLAASSLDVYPISVAPTKTDVVPAKKGTKIKIPITVHRREGGKGAVILRARTLPPGVTAADLTIAADKTEAEWTIDVTANAKPGTYTFWGQGETKVKFAVNPQALTRSTEYRDHLKTLRGDASRSAEHAAIDKAIVEADKQIEAIKKQAAPKDFAVYVPTPLITLKVE